MYLGSMTGRKEPRRERCWKHCHLFFVHAVRESSVILAADSGWFLDCVQACARSANVVRPKLLEERAMENHLQIELGD